MKSHKESFLDVHVLRKSLHLNQVDFWGPLGITQSGGSRYENGRNIPKPVQTLILLAYGKHAEAIKLLGELRKHQPDQLRDKPRPSDLVA